MKRLSLETGGAMRPMMMAILLFLASLSGPVNVARGVDQRQRQLPQQERSPVPLVVTFTVATTTDGVDAKPGDGHCRTAGGTCTLRAAIMEANALPGRQTITVPNGIYKLMIPGQREDAGRTGDLDITDHLTIAGANTVETIIDGNATDRVIHVLNTASVVLSRLTVRNGKPEEFASGAGIRNLGELTLDHVVVSGNTGTSAVANINGTARIAHSAIQDNHAIGIENSGHPGVLDLRHSTVSRNTGGPISPGGVGNFAGTLTITDSQITGNACGQQTAYGGGVLNDRGTATLIRVTVSGNSCGYSGGGIANIQFWYTPVGKLTIADSTVSGNSAMHGGGIMNYGPLALTNVTLSGNVATLRGGRLGTQLATDGSGAPYAVTTAVLNGVRIVNCRAGSGGGIYNWAPGPYGGQSQAVQLSATTLAHNEPENCVGTITSLGNNVDSGSTCGFTKRGDRANSVLQPGPLGR